MFYNKKSFRYNVVFLTILLLLSLFLSGCENKTEALMEEQFVLNTIATVTFYRERDRAAVQEAMALCREYELVFSRTDSRSELYRLNEADCMEVSDDLRRVLETGLEYCRVSGGAFDITLGGVSALYDFSGADPHSPAPEALAEALRHTGYEHVHIEGNLVHIDEPDTVIDLGALAKGYIADQMKARLSAAGVEHAIISLGGNILTLGGKPDGSDYRIGIRYPEKASSQLADVVAVSELSVVTSGIYERFFEENGRLYHHILDPESGTPVENDLLAVSVVGPDSLDCDALTTVCFALGKAEGLALIERMEGYEALFISADKSLHPSSGFHLLRQK